MVNGNDKAGLPREVMDPLRTIYRVVGNEQVVEEDPMEALSNLLKKIEEEIPSATTAILAGLIRQACEPEPYRWRRERRQKNAA